MKTIFLMLLVIPSLTFATPELETKEAFKSQLNVLVFNIKKMQYRGWNAEAFESLVTGSDLVLIQESVNNFPTYEFSEGLYFDVFYKSWGNDEYDTGVSSLSKAPNQSSEIMISPVTEPIANTPKVSSVETYSVEGLSEELMVINTHGINFVGVYSFQKQIKALYEKVSKHEGPMIWAGDFNTWSWGRKKVLDSFTEKLGLSEVAFEERSELFLELDHAYVRGGVVTEAKQLQVGLSDHEPLVFKIDFSEENQSLIK